MTTPPSEPMGKVGYRPESMGVHKIIGANQS